MNIKEYGVKKTWDNKWQTFANAQEWLRKELKKLGVNYDKK